MKTLTANLFLCIAILLLLACKNTTYTSTSFTISITHPDPSVNDKNIIIKISSAVINVPDIILRGVLSSNSITREVQVPDYYFINGRAEIAITSFLFEDPEDKDIDVEMYRNIPSFFMYDPNNTEAYGSTKSVIQGFTLERDRSQTFRIDFPNSLNIQMEHENFATNNPVVSWNPYPGVMVNYKMAILVREKDDYQSEWEIGNTTWLPAYTKITSDTFVTAYSNLVNFVESYGSEGIVMSPYLRPGDVFRVEVYAYDSAARQTKETVNQQIFIDTLTILVK